MQLPFGKLQSHLRTGMVPVYLLSGDEPFQLMEAADNLRAHARSEGYDEREVMYVESGFDWSALEAVSSNLSLFEQRRLIDLRMPGKPGIQGSKAITNFLKQPAEDIVLIIQTGKLDRSAQNSAWVKAIDKAGVVLRVWPLDSGQMQQWIRQRFQQRGFSIEDTSIEFLAARAEGNLLAAAQEIDKLCLTYEPGKLDPATLLESVADSSRFSIFDLADSALSGDAAHAIRMLNGLRAEGVKPPLILWSLAEQVRTMLSMSRKLAEGDSMDSLMKHIWQKRKPIVRRALQRKVQAEWEKLLAVCASLDRVIKSQAEANAWEELLQLTFDISRKDSSNAL